MNESEKTIERVVGAFENLGSSTQQARVMATQLVKRANQLARERGTTLVEELGKLLETVSCGSQGRLKPTDIEDFS